MLALYAPLAISAAACTRERATPPPARPADSASLAGAVPALPAPLLSRLDVPLAYNFSEVLETVERVVPKTFGSLDSVQSVGGDDRTHYAFVATRGPFTAFAQGSELHLRATLSYTARGYYKAPIVPTLSAGCGWSAPRPRLIAELVAPMTLTPTWHLKTASRIAKLEPASDADRDHCRISFLSFDVTQHVVDAARAGLARQLARIDARVGAVNLTDQATEWWRDLNKAIRLSDGVWLLLQPRQFRLKGFSGERHVLTVAAGLDAFPVIVTGPRPAPVVSPLPPLGHDSGTTGFRVTLEGTVDYATASRALTSELRGKAVAIGKRSVRVRSISAGRNAAGRLVLAIAFVGDAVGTLQLVGTPRLNRVASRIEVNDLDFDLTTNSQLLNAYDWLRTYALLKFFREKARLPVAPVVERAGRLMGAGLNQTFDGVLTIAATVDSLAVLGVYVTPGGVTVRALVIGTGSVAVHQRR